MFLDNGKNSVSWFWIDFHEQEHFLKLTKLNIKDLSVVCELHLHNSSSNQYSGTH